MSEADGGMQRDAGVIGCRLTAAEDAIDAAVLDGRRDHSRSCGMPIRLLATGGRIAAHDLLELEGGRS